MHQVRHRSANVALGNLRPVDLWRDNLTREIWGKPEDVGRYSSAGQAGRIESTGCEQGVCP